MSFLQFYYWEHWKEQIEKRGAYSHQSSSSSILKGIYLSENLEGRTDFDFIFCFFSSRAADLIYVLWKERKRNVLFFSPLSHTNTQKKDPLQHQPQKRRRRSKIENSSLSLPDTTPPKKQPKQPCTFFTLCSLKKFIFILTTYLPLHHRIWWLCCYITGA